MINERPIIFKGKGLCEFIDKPVGFSNYYYKLGISTKNGVKTYSNIVESNCYDLSSPAIPIPEINIVNENMIRLSWLSEYPTQLEVLRSDSIVWLKIDGWRNPGYNRLDYNLQQDDSPKFRLKLKTTKGEILVGKTFTI